MSALLGLLSGLLFGAGLLLSGMTNPANVLAFLDIAGHWQPALAFTMAAAVAVAAPAYALIRLRGRALRGQPVAAPPTRIDAPLLLGSGIFGVGWGLSGVCPGPGIVLLASGAPQAFAFVGAVVIGTIIGNITTRHADSAGTLSAPAYLFRRKLRK